MAVLIIDQTIFIPDSPAVSKEQEVQQMTHSIGRGPGIERQKQLLWQMHGIGYCKMTLLYYMLP